MGGVRVSNRWEGCSRVARTLPAQREGGCLQRQAATITYHLLKLMAGIRDVRKLISLNALSLKLRARKLTCMARDTRQRLRKVVCAWQTVCRQTGLWALLLGK